MVYLLDANVLIAMTVAEHEHHRRVSSWLSTVDRAALCPVVEGSLVDAYLAALVATRDGALLATLDEGLTHDRPALTLLVPRV